MGRPRRNPSGSDPMLMMMGMAVLGGVAYFAFGGKMPGGLGTPAPVEASGGSGGRPGGTGHGPTGAAPPCGFSSGTGTRMDFAVTPSNPDALEGASVMYSGRLMTLGLVGGWIPAGGKTIEFRDGASCERFDDVITDGQGYFSHTRPLRHDELEGYSVFAFWPGQQAFLGVGNQDAYTTGVWNVVPHPAGG